MSGSFGFALPCRGCLPCFTAGLLRG